MSLIYSLLDKADDLLLFRFGQTWHKAPLSVSVLPG